METKVQTRSQAKNGMVFSAILSQIEPKNLKKALKDAYWINLIQEELQQFEKSKVRHLVPRPVDRIIIKTKWVYRKKQDESGTININKARLVVQGYN